MGRIKEISRKSAHTRKRNPVVYLICEGSETEIRYFKRFRSRGCNIDIIPISSQYKSADKLVQKAKATMGNNPYYPEDYRGHSLSVSDIVVLHQNGKNSAHFVDSFGFTRLPDFMQTLEGVKEQEAEIDTSGHDVQKSEPEKQEQQTSDNTLEDGDEIIDLGDEKEQVLADMKKSLELGEETELAFQIADRYISIQEVDGGYDYSIMGADYKELDGGVYDNPDVTIREALTDIVDDLKAAPDHNGAKGSIKEKDELIPIDYEGLMEKVEEANEVVPKNQESSIITDFRAKTNEVFHDISEMNPAEIEETIKCHVQAKIDEYDIDATIIDAVVVGSRCRGLEKDSSDLDVVVELSTNEREDDLFNAFNEDVFSEAHWRIIENFVKTAVDNGINMLLMPVFTLPLDTKVGGERPTTQLVGVEKTADGYVFDFSLVGRWLDMCARCGVKYHEISHLFIYPMGR